jgi:hypothetical protein
MANETNSLQEAMLKELAEHSFAAPFVFAPDNQLYQDREPADLVWACNNCIILMYMTERKEHADPNKRVRICQDAIDHNLSQARRWLRTWKSGSDLRGSNRFHTFSLVFNPKCHVIILSVIKCGDAVGQFHDAEAKNLGVKCCVTLPQSAVDYLVHAAGPALDILIVLEQMHKLWGQKTVSEADILKLINSYVQDMWKAADVEDQWPGGKPDDRLNEAAYFLLTSRRRKSGECPTGPPVDWKGINELWDVFNDINIGEFLLVTRAVRKGIELANDPAHREGIIELAVPLNIYDFKMFFLHGLSDEKAEQIKSIVEGREGQLGTDIPRYGPTLVWDVKDRIFHVLLGKRVGQSQTEAFLDQWAVC